MDEHEVDATGRGVHPQRHQQRCISSSHSKQARSGAEHEDLRLAVYPIPLRTRTKQSQYSLNLFPFASSSITVRVYVYLMQPNSSLVGEETGWAMHVCLGGQLCILAHC